MTSGGAGAGAGTGGDESAQRRFPDGIRPGAANSLTDVAGISVGHARRADDGWLTGVTVVLTGPDGAVCGVDVRGGAPGTRETDLLDPRNSVQRAHAIVLTGGSAYGLAAVDGVMARLADACVGYPVGPGSDEVVPIVPAAVIFDLGRGGTFRATPDVDLGAAAYDAAVACGHPGQGSVGAGTGALAGGFAGGVGMASAVLPSGAVIGALAVVNAAGSPADPRTGELYGARFGLAGEFAWLSTPPPAERAAWRPGMDGIIFNTTIGVVATDAALTKAQCARLAAAAQDGLARAIRPAHTMLDGDTIFALASGNGDPARAGEFHDLFGAAADAFSRAIVHAVLAASGRMDAPSYLDVFPSVSSLRPHAGERR